MCLQTLGVFCVNYSCGAAAMCISLCPGKKCELCLIRSSKDTTIYTLGQFVPKYNNCEHKVHNVTYGCPLYTTGSECQSSRKRCEHCMDISTSLHCPLVSHSIRMSCVEHGVLCLEVSMLSQVTGMRSLFSLGAVTHSYMFCSCTLLHVELLCTPPAICSAMLRYVTLVFT